MDRFFTRLYVATDLPLQQLLEHVRRMLGADAEMATLSTSIASVYFDRSDDYDRVAHVRDPSDFLRYPYSVEIESVSNVVLDRYLELVASIMLDLHAHGATVVASCDWEDNLPGCGKLGAAFST